MNQNNLGISLDLHNFSNKNIFITGGTGFFGKNILNYLIQHKIRPQRVTILSRNVAKFKLAYPELSQAEWLDFVQSDIRNLEWNNQAYDYFIHAATSVTEQSSSDILFNEIVIGTDKALSFAKKANVRVFVNISSGGVYAQNKQLVPLQESAALTADITNPKASYGIGKISAEHLACTYSLNSAMKVLTLRCFCFAGKYLDAQHFAIGEFIQKALKNEVITINAGTGIYRSYLSTDDLVNKMLQLTLLSELSNEQYSVYNLGSDQAINLHDLARFVVKTLDSSSEIITPNQNAEPINYYVPHIAKLNSIIQVQTQPLEKIIHDTAEYYRQNKLASLNKDDISCLPSNQGINHARNSVSAIIACYNDAQAIPIMAERLVKVFTKCEIDYEIIFVSNGSRDNSIEVIQELSRNNARISGVTHSRSFEQTSQASFLNGMSLSTKQACVLLDGDLQDPPEMIEDFVSKWREGYDIVYGIRHKREAPLFVQIGSKIFYRLFDKLSAVPMPHDAGDFSLIDRRPMEYMLSSQEHDVLIRGMRAFVGFKHTGIKYFRPERMFGKSSNNFFKLIMWLKKGIFSYSRKPLDWMTTAGFALVSLSVLLAAIQIVIRIFMPDATPHGLTTIILLIMFFGSFTILGISILGEYIAKIVEETKNRPVYIRDVLIKNGEIINIHQKDYK